MPLLSTSTFSPNRWCQPKPPFILLLNIDALQLENEDRVPTAVLFLDWPSQVEVQEGNHPRHNDCCIESGTLPSHLKWHPGVSIRILY